jgi:hypothetical protein
MHAISALGATIARLDCALQKNQAQAYVETKMSDVEKYISRIDHYWYIASIICVFTD